MSRISSIIPRVCAASLASFTVAIAAAEKPVKVYILSGQSNMVGIGQVTGNDLRWGKEVTATVTSTPSPRVFARFKASQP